MKRHLGAKLLVVGVLLGMLAMGCAEEEDGFTVGAGRRNPSPTAEATPADGGNQQTDPSTSPSPSVTPKPTPTSSPTATPRPRESTIFISSPGPEPSPPGDASGDIEVEEP